MEVRKLDGTVVSLPNKEAIRLLNEGKAVPVVKHPQASSGAVEKR